MSAAPRDLQSLLAWSTANTPADDGTTRAAPSRQPAQRLDPGIIEAILGKTDAVKMRELVGIVGDFSGKSLDERMAAWDELEMILESLDNANDLQPLGLWPQITGHLTSTEDDTVVQALWVSGTAINNNPKARDDFLRQDPLPILISLPRASNSNADVRSKALYCLGGVLKHNDASLQRFTELEGWPALEESLKDPSLPCRRKAAFLLAALLSEETTQAIARDGVLTRSSIVAQLVASLSSATAQPTGVNGDGEGYDEDVAESAVRALRGLGVERLQPSDRKAMKEAINNAAGETPFGMAVEEEKELLQQLES